MARALHRAWLPGVAFAEWKLDEDLGRQGLQKIGGCGLDDLELSGPPTAILNPNGKLRMREEEPNILRPGLESWSHQ